jgi:hypothetical protein
MPNIDSTVVSVIMHKKYTILLYEYIGEILIQITWKIEWDRASRGIGARRSVGSDQECIISYLNLIISYNSNYEVRKILVIIVIRRMFRLNLPNICEKDRF